MTKGKEKGFTLLEVILAMAILAFITASVWASLYSIASSKASVEKRDDFQQMIRIVLDRLTQDLSLAFAIPQSARKTGFSTRNDRLSFTTLSHREMDPYLKECETTMVSYLMENDTERPGLYILKRKENRRLTEDFSEDDTRPIELLKGITRLEFEYYDGEKFAKNWDFESMDALQKGKIPKAVKIDLVVKDERGDEHHFYTMINPVFSRIEPTTFVPPLTQTGQGGTTKGDKGGKDSQKGTEDTSKEKQNEGSGEEGEQ